MTAYNAMLWGLESLPPETAPWQSIETQNLYLSIINQNRHNPRPRKRMRSRSNYPSASFRNQPDSRLRKVAYHLFTTIGVICLALVFGGMLGILFSRLFAGLP